MSQTTTPPYCRLCTLKSENYIDVFHSDDTGLQLVNKIKQCLQIVLLADDVLPKTVCVGCCEKVLEFSEFFNMCSKSQQCLIQVITKDTNMENMDFIENLDCIQPQDNLLENNLEENILSCDEASDDANDETDKRVWKCATCDMNLPTLRSLKSHHLSIHQQLPVFKCHICFKVYSHYRSFARHLKGHTNPFKFTCDICFKSFSQKTTLQSHMAVHSEVRPHVCMFCGKSFKQFSSLYLHSKVHVPDDERVKYDCEECDKSFSNKQNLETHLKVHKGEKNFICDVCGKRFYSKQSLDYHMLSHTDDKPHTCPTCGKKFKMRRLLAKHVTVHTGIKPHQCDVCGKTFRERGALKEHSRIHTGAMPYSCEFCGKLFRFKGILTVHRRLHTGERPYSCEACNRGFTNWANYNKHMKRRHNNVKPQQPPEDNLPLVENYDEDQSPPDTIFSTFPPGQQFEHDGTIYRVNQYPSGSQLQGLNTYYLPLHTNVTHVE